MDASHLISDFSRHCSPSPNTLLAYTRDIKCFLDFMHSYNSGFELDGLGNISAQDIRSWLTYRVTQKGISKRSNNRALSALKALYKYLKEIHAIDNKALISARYARTPRLLPKPVSTDIIQQTLNSIPSDSWIGLRDKALVMLMYGCGLRISEALGLPLAQPDADFIKVIGKGNKERLVPLLPEVATALKEYANARPASSCKLLFIGEKGKALSRNYFTRRLSQLSAGGIHAHTLRHSCASHLLENGGSILSIQRLLGHASLTSTQIYSEVSKTKALQEYNSCHPRTRHEKA